MEPVWMARFVSDMMVRRLWLFFVNGTFFNPQKARSMLCARCFTCASTILPTRSAEHWRSCVAERVQLRLFCWIWICTCGIPREPCWALRFWPKFQLGMIRWTKRGLAHRGNIDLSSATRWASFVKIDGAYRCINELSIVARGPTFWHYWAKFLPDAHRENIYQVL